MEQDWYEVRPMYQFHPLTPERWSDFEALFGPRGACAGCWCTFFRQSRKEFDANKGEANKALMQGLVESGAVPGLLAYEGSTPVGWCSVAPRSEFTALARSRNLKPIDDQPVWSVVCFFVAKGHRRKGLTVGLLEAAAAYVRQQGGTIVEGYPIEPDKTDYADAWAFVGLAGAFRKAGFVEVARPGSRVIMRRTL